MGLLQVAPLLGMTYGQGIPEKLAPIDSRPIALPIDYTSKFGMQSVLAHKKQPWNPNITFVQQF